MKNIKNVFFVLILLLTSIWSNITLAEEGVNLIIRDGENIIFQDSVLLQPAGTIELMGHSLDANSVLAVLNDADLASETFAITDLQYYDSFGSFYLKCINDKCDNWQYVVDNENPGIGMDQKILSGGEEIYLYFGQQHRINLCTNNIETDENLIVTAENYVYQDNSWEPFAETTIGIIEDNPDNPFSPIEILTQNTNDDGQAIFSNIPIGEYKVGIKDDYYFPTENLTVIENKKHSSSGSYVYREELGENNLEIKKSFNIEKAFAYLISKQEENGSFGEELYTDWVAIAFASNPNYLEQKNLLAKFFSENKFLGESLTDHERHAMALMSLGLNPYSTNGENHIQKIIDAFDGNQIGNPEEINDDIFGLIVLQNTGFTENDEIIKKTTEFIVSKQKENGSWYDSVDLTGAGIVSLSFLNQSEQIKNTLIKAGEFLKEKEKNGNWENISSTAWALEGKLALKEEIENSTKEYFGENQAEDGGIKEENIQNKIWQTAYVLTSLSGKTWTEIMQKFDKKEEIITNSPIVERINNSHSTKFAKKIESFQKPVEFGKTNITETESLPPNPIKKQNWFRRLIGKIFGF